MKIKETVKCVPVILGYFLLTEIGKMIEFWIFMAHQTESDLYEQQWSWITMPESRLFQIPGKTGASVNPAIIEAVKYGILAAWAYVESVLDIRALLDGDKIKICVWDS